MTLSLILFQELTRNKEIGNKLERFRNNLVYDNKQQKLWLGYFRSLLVYKMVQDQLEDFCNNKLVILREIGSVVFVERIPLVGMDCFGTIELLVIY